jgi:hypothetical protein
MEHAERMRENTIVSEVLSPMNADEIECESKTETFNRLAVCENDWVVKTRKDSMEGN